jgi:predicted aldo/keto reductase-like oxidoreductase
MADHRISRRTFLCAGGAAAAAATSGRFAAVGAEEAAQQKEVQTLPRRVLGRTGIAVTILNQGEVANVSDRHLNLMHEEGVRCLDASAWYGGGRNERTVGEWLNKTSRRTEYFLATKDHPRSPGQWVKMLDRRLVNGRQEYYDLFLIHGLGAGAYPRGCVRWPKEREWAKAADGMRKSGKARFVGFSACCDPIGRRTELLNHAAEGGWVDAIMVAVDPLLIRDNAAFNKALDACHAAGVGLIAMKEMRGRGNIRGVFPEFEARGLNPFTAVLTAMWTDERFATISSYMDNITKLRQNAAAARSFRPMTDGEVTAVHRMLDGHAKGYCIGCDGSCRRAAGTETAFNEVARYLCYYEENGDREGARRLFAALRPEARDWSNADLAAASKACVGGLDFESILARAAEKLA